jgi:predicted metal-dependent phosphoesterase TrpH
MASSKRHPEPVVDWKAALIAELRGPDIPPDAVSAYDIAAKAGCSRYKATDFLKAAVEEGRMRTAMKAVNNTLTRFYWPA